MPKYGNSMTRSLKLFATALALLGLLAGTASARPAPTKFSRLDPSYGTHGSYAVATSKTEGQALNSLHLALAHDGEAYVLQGQTLLAFSPDGRPDHNFGKNGRVWVNPGPGLMVKAIGVAVDPVGRIFVAGTYISFPGFHNPLVKGSVEYPPNEEPSEGFVVRYLPNGTPDPNFGTGGVSTSTFGVPRPVGYSPFEKPTSTEYERPSVELTQLTVDSQGRAVVAGAYASALVNCGYSNRYVQSFASRLTSSGAVDPSFGDSGYVTLPGGATGSITLGPGGELVALSSQAYPCSEHGSGPGPYWFTSALTEAGESSPTLDPARPMVGADTGLAVDSQGRILLTEWNNPGQLGIEPEGLKLIRLLPSGDLDTSFGHDGAANLRHFKIGGPSIAVDGKGRTVLAFGGTEPKLIRISSTGKLEHGFSKKTVLHLTIARVASTETEAMAIDSKGRIVVAGRAEGGALKTGYGVGIARVLPPR
jgi:uncharacterized delta-60 repeat protein